GVLRKPVEVGANRGPEPIEPIAPSLRRRGDHGLEVLIYAFLVGGQKALGLVLEVLVEGRLRDACRPDDVNHAGRAVALLGDYLGRRLAEATSVVRRDDRPRQSVGAARKAGSSDGSLAAGHLGKPIVRSR